jgi:hypothetical protein
MALPLKFWQCRLLLFLRLRTRNNRLKCRAPTYSSAAQACRDGDCAATHAPSRAHEAARDTILSGLYPFGRFDVEHAAECLADGQPGYLVLSGRRADRRAFPLPGCDAVAGIGRATIGWGISAHLDDVLRLHREASRQASPVYRFDGVISALDVDPSKHEEARSETRMTGPPGGP